MKAKYLILLFLLCSGCTPSLLRCLIKFPDFDQTYPFALSKEALKTKLVEAYTYDKSLFAKNLGLTLIENEQVNAKYRQSTEIWLSRQNWKEAKSDILKQSADTLHLRIGKHHGRKQLQFIATIHGDQHQSSLRIQQVSYSRKRACNKDRATYRIRIANIIERKLIKRLQ